MNLIEKILFGIQHVLDNEDMTPIAREDLNAIVKMIKESNGVWINDQVDY